MGSKMAIVSMAGHFRCRDGGTSLAEYLRQEGEHHLLHPEQLRKAGVPDALINHPDYIPCQRGVKQYR